MNSIFSTSISQLVSLLVIVALLTMVQGYQQEITLYESEESGNSFTFRSHIPDATIYPLQNVVRVCYRGHWEAYSKVDYNGGSTIFHDNPMECQNVTFGEFQSFRHIAKRETTEIGLSLYAGLYWTGQEVLLTETVTGNIENPIIQSVAWTGNDTWTLFEGVYFTGGRACLKAPPANFEFYAYGNVDYILRMRTVKSAIRGGCYIESSMEEIMEIVKQSQTS